MAGHVLIEIILAISPATWVLGNSRSHLRIGGASHMLTNPAIPLDFFPK